MDPFTEKDLIEVLRSISLGLKEIKDELFDIKIAIRELSLDEDEIEDEIEEDIEDISEEDGKIVKNCELVDKIEEDECADEDAEEKVIGFTISEEDAVTSEEFKEE